MAQKLKKKNTTVKKIVKKVKPVISTAKAADHGAQTFTMPKGEFVQTVGRRKVATARVRVYKQPGDFVVNNKVVGDYFATIPLAHSLYNLPLQVTDNMGKFAISVKVGGSGVKGQLGAVMHGLARALVKIDPELISILRKNGLLTRDDRMKETRKIGMGGKARRSRQSPKR